MRGSLIELLLVLMRGCVIICPWVSGWSIQDTSELISQVINLPHT
eukprot:COSAG01_NODE_8686_length_2696_cov_9.890258_2_plen_45_part_00